MDDAIVFTSNLIHNNDKLTKTKNTINLRPKVRQWTTVRPSVDGQHADHLSLADNDVMEVAMTGDLLLESQLDEENNNNTIGRADYQYQDEDSFEEDDKEEGGLIALEQFFDRQFHTFPSFSTEDDNAKQLAAADWSLGPDDEVPLTH